MVELEVPPLGDAMRARDGNAAGGVDRNGARAPKGEPMKVAGIDAGSRTIKIVLYDAGQRRVLGRGIRDQGVQQEELAAPTGSTRCWRSKG